MVIYMDAMCIYDANKKCNECNECEKEFCMCDFALLGATHQRMKCTQCGMCYDDPMDA